MIDITVCLKCCFAKTKLNEFPCNECIHTIANGNYEGSVEHYEVRKPIPKNVKEIVIEYLQDNGFDGLYAPGECGCELADLIPCLEPCEDCIPGYKREPTEEDKEEYGDTVFVISGVKE